MFRVCVVLTPGCSWLATALLTEPWRIANRDVGSAVVDWSLASWTGGPVIAANGMEIAVAGRCTDLADGVDAVVVIASEDVPTASDPALLEWLASLGTTGVLLAGVDAGPELLADAGVLVGHAAAVHHETLPVFRERFLGIELAYGRYSIDDTRATCAGSSTTLDFSLALLARFVGRAVAASTAETLIHTPHDDPAAPAESATSMLDDRLRRAMHFIANESAEPGVIQRAADAAGVSDRHLHRLCTEELGMTPRAFAQQVRMRRARTLVRETRLPVGAIASACGYGGASDFNRAFRRHFGRTPTQMRAEESRSAGVSAGSRSE